MIAARIIAAVENPADICAISSGTFAQVSAVGHEFLGCL